MPVPPSVAVRLLAHPSQISARQKVSSPTGMPTPKLGPSLCLELCSLLTVPFKRSLALFFSLLQTRAILSFSESQVIPVQFCHLCSASLSPANPAGICFALTYVLAQVSFYLLVPTPFQRKVLPFCNLESPSFVCCSSVPFNFPAAPTSY